MSSRGTHFLNDYTEEKHYAALNNQNVYVSHSGDLKPNPIYHVHNSCELLFIEEGEARYRIGDSFYDIGPGDVLIIGGTDPHGREFRKLPCYRFGLTIMPVYLQSLPIINTYMNVYQTHNVQEAARLKNLEPELFGRMIDILIQLRAETDKNNKGDGEMVYALLLELTILLQRRLQMEKQIMSETYQNMSRIKTFIDLHYDEEINLNRLSQMFYLQPNTISKNFSRIFGKNIIAYLNSVRVTNAVRILEENSISITELSEVVGYSSINTFLRQFHQKMNVSPLQYKKQFEKMKLEGEQGHILLQQEENIRISGVNLVK